MNKASGWVVLVCVLMALYTPLADAAEGILVEQVRQDVPDDAVMSVIKQALARRKWTVAAEDAGSVVAELSNSSTAAKIGIFLAGRSIHYRELSVTQDFVPTNFSPGSSGNRHPIKVSVPVPEKWLADLRLDMTEQLSGYAAAPRAEQQVQQESTRPAPSARARLETLKELLDAKLITQSEYEQKRQQILDGL
jgi:Short C-terminal domain